MGGTHSHSERRHMVYTEKNAANIKVFKVISDT